MILLYVNVKTLFNNYITCSRFLKDDSWFGNILAESEVKHEIFNKKIYFYLKEIPRKMVVSLLATHRGIDNE